MFRFWALLACAAALTAAESSTFSIGRKAGAEEIKGRDITIFPDGRGLPAGSGTAEQGRKLFADKCSVCHNDKGEGRQGQYPSLVGGIGSLKSGKPVKTVGSYWPYATTLWDTIHRAMPFDNPRSLSADEVYALTAFVLNLNGIVEPSQQLNAKTLPAIRMPNRDGFIRDIRPVTKQIK